MPESETLVPRPQTDRDTWLHAATQTLADSGVDGVKVESLARQLGLTKGSFYWHFKDRRALLDALLDHWRTGRIDDITQRTQCAPGHEIAQLHHVIDTYSLARNQRGMRVELAIRDWARHDAAAQSVIDAVDAVRLDCATALFAAAGHGADEAASRSLLLYAYVFGLGMMDGEREALRPAASRTFIARLITGG
ncbi:TetR/AcrR family transcriptional regulator [Methyloversatilis sp. XJ19-49]|uniref:TetR/AcrR family transcriptional regulator n=1 Tax=Methyloversatilis sp. XJ19-49 TaxID=2963429 RepID=UPI00211CE8E8|nr:TetR/AcrR family transcriptional regulator [Methyloversatilis sp. XJ19-49]MCQ9376901.1 TetR/AcrR family transcriptional regulator [Methyloversatilis sp. XJ19-49]